MPTTTVPLQLHHKIQTGFTVPDTADLKIPIKMGKTGTKTGKMGTKMGKMGTKMGTMPSPYPHPNPNSTPKGPT